MQIIVQNYSFSRRIRPILAIFTPKLCGDVIDSNREGADEVIFGTCLYVGAAAFIRKFQGSPLVWWD